MENKIVKTITGQEHEESRCRLIDGKYYLIGDNTIEDSGDVYLINNRYIRASTERIVYDHFNKEYRLKNASIIEGIIGTNGDEIILGYFSRNDLYNVKVVLKDGTEKLAISKNVLKYAFRERRSDGDFYHISIVDAISFNKLRSVSREVKESLPYDSKNSIDRVAANFEANYNPIICKGASSVGIALKHYTFGIEFETCNGIIPNSKLKHLPLIPLRDGSIGGIEYATIPLQGERGVQAIIDSVEELKSRTDFGDDCSLHLHIGGMPRTVEFILAFYKMISFFQNEMFEMFPLYKKYNFGVKRKNYSSPFPFETINFKMEPSIDVRNKSQLIKNFDKLFVYLSGGHSFGEYDNDLKNVLNHPQDPNGNAKWNIKNRYSFVNLIPLIFGNHKTIEFRIHTPTYEVNKIVNFLMLNTFMIDYVSQNINNILIGTNPLLMRPSLSLFVDEYVSRNIKIDSKAIYSELSNYITTRRKFSFDLARTNGVVYHEDQVKLYSKMRFNSYQFQKNYFENKKSWFDLPESGLSPFHDKVIKELEKSIRSYSADSNGFGTQQFSRAFGSDALTSNKVLKTKPRRGSQIREVYEQKLIAEHLSIDNSSIGFGISNYPSGSLITRTHGEDLSLNDEGKVKAIAEDKTFDDWDYFFSDLDPIKETLASEEKIKEDAKDNLF